MVPTKQCARNVRKYAMIIALMKMVKKKRTVPQLIKRLVFAKNAHISGMSTLIIDKKNKKLFRKKKYLLTNKCLKSIT